MNSVRQTNAILSERVEEAIARLGYAVSGSLIRSVEELAGSANHHVVRQAFETIGVSAVFGFNSGDIAGRRKFTPIVYLAAATQENATAIHRLVWSQGVVPLLLIVTPDGLEIRRSLAPPPERPIKVTWSDFATDPLPKELTSLTSVALRSSIVWQDFAIDRAKRIDKVLLDGIVQLSEVVGQKETGRLERSTLHAIIGRFLYLYVLLDRRVIGSDWIARLKGDEGQQLCPTIAEALSSSAGNHSIWPTREVWALFDQIDKVMNGAVFPVTASQRTKISEQSLHLIHRVIRHGDQIGPQGRQLSFLDVSFATLRTETISAIYELFLALESADEQSDDGAFYTPPFLVDYVLDETDRLLPFHRNSRVLDPAAGSGIFLVGAFRRIVERALPAGKWNARHFHSARKILESSIFGIERNPQAANVCRFSLYLTLLDYMSGFDIVALERMTKLERVFPRLVGNIRSIDAFAKPEIHGPLGTFSHVVGNPPWGSFGDSATRTNEPRLQERQEKIIRSMAAAVEYHATLDPVQFPVSNKRLSELFIWKIKQDFLAKKGALGILISTKSFVSRSASTFPNAVAKQFRLAGIANLSHFRYRLFAGARSPTIAIFASNEEPDPMDQIWTYSPLLSSQPIGETGHLWSIIVNSMDVETHRLRDYTRTPQSWFDNLILRPLDRRYARHIRAWSEKISRSLGGFLESSGLAMLRGGSPIQTGLPDRLLLKAGNYRQSLGLEGFGFASYPHDELANYSPHGRYAQLFQGNILLIPRSLNDFVVVRQPVAFASTFNAIYFLDEFNGEKEVALLDAIAAYLKSDVAYYCFALTGRSWILDHARLEKNDLLALPFPFTVQDRDAIETLRSGNQSQITTLVTKQIGLDALFQSTVDEYSTFRKGYEDSQLPQTSLTPPGAKEITNYRNMLSEQLLQNFGSKSKVSVGVTEKIEADHFVRLLVNVRRQDDDRVGGVNEPQTIPVSFSSQFNPYTTISYDAQNDIISMVKPWTHVAWTIEQAFADARGVSAAILRPGAFV